MADAECIFCKIGAGVVPSDTVFEDELIRAFSDIHPKAPTHILVIPKEHIESVAHLTGAHEALAGKLLAVARDIASNLGLAGYKLVFNVGRDGGQVIDHLHLHLLGGWKTADER